METMEELLMRANMLGWYEEEACDSYIILSPIAEKDDMLILSTIYIEWGQPAPTTYEIQEVGAGWKFINTRKTIPDDILEVIKKMLIVHD